MERRIVLLDARYENELDDDSELPFVLYEQLSDQMVIHFTPRPSYRPVKITIEFEYDGFGVLNDSSFLASLIPFSPSPITSPNSSASPSSSGSPSAVSPMSFSSPDSSSSESLVPASPISLVPTSIPSSPTHCLTCARSLFCEKRPSPPDTLFKNQQFSYPALHAFTPPHSVGKHMNLRDDSGNRKYLVAPQTKSGEVAGHPRSKRIFFITLPLTNDSSKELKPYTDEDIKALRYFANFNRSSHNRLTNPNLPYTLLFFEFNDTNPNFERQTGTVVPLEQCVEKKSCAELKCSISSKDRHLHIEKQWGIYKGERLTLKCHISEVAAKKSINYDIIVLLVIPQLDSPSGELYRLYQFAFRGRTGTGLPTFLSPQLNGLKSTPEMEEVMRTLRQAKRSDFPPPPTFTD